jgi:hypothetical protein
MTISHTPYVYKFTHLPTLKWYVGSRFAKQCHPDDGYTTSSKIVKPAVIANPEEWKKEIIATGTVEEVRDLESEILELFDARNNNRSFNEHNSRLTFRFDRTGVKASDETRKLLSISHAGKKKPNPKIVGRKQSAEHIAKRAAKLKLPRKKWTLEARERKSQFMKNVWMLKRQKNE